MKEMLLSFIATIRIRKLARKTKLATAEDIPLFYLDSESVMTSHVRIKFVTKRILRKLRFCIELWIGQYIKYRCHKNDWLAISHLKRLIIKILFRILRLETLTNYTHRFNFLIFQLPCDLISCSFSFLFKRFSLKGYRLKGF